MSSTLGSDRSARAGIGPLVLAGAAGAAAVALLTALLTRTPVWSVTGLPEAGELTRNGVVAVKVLVTVASVVCVGALLAAAFLLPRQRTGMVDDDARPALRTAAGAASVWLVTSLAAVLFTTAEAIGMPVGQLALSPGKLIVAVNALEQAKSWLVTAVLVLFVVFGCQRARTWTHTAGLFLLATLALLPVAVTGHSAAGGAHDIATSSLIYHLVAASLWIGGLVAVVALGRSRHLVTAVHRFSRLALVCWVVMAASGLVNVWVRVEEPLDLLSSSYGALLLAKLVALGVLGWFGYRHRSRTIQALTWGDNRRPLMRLAAIEILVMFVTIGVSAALGRTTPPPRASALPSDVELLIGYDLAGPPTVARLLFDWRFELIFGVLAILLAAAYLAGVRRLAGRWAVNRTVSWLAGCLVLLVATSSGIARYGAAVFSVHMVQQLLLAVVAPILLVRGAPITLTLRAAKRDGAPREWLTALLHSPACRALTRPAVGFALLVVPMVLLYGADVFSSLAGNRWADLATNAYFLTAGYLLFWPVAGADPAPRPVSSAARIGALVALLPVFAVLALAMVTTRRVIGEFFYWSLDVPWGGDPLVSQQLGAVVLLFGGTVPVVAVLAAMVIRARKPVNSTAPAAV